MINFYLLIKFNILDHFELKIIRILSMLIWHTFFHSIRILFYRINFQVLQYRISLFFYMNLYK